MARPPWRLAAVLRQQQLRQLAAVQLFARHAAAQRRLLEPVRWRGPWVALGALGEMVVGRPGGVKVV